MRILGFSLVARTRNHGVGGFQRPFFNSYSPFQLVIGSAVGLSFDRSQRMSCENIGNAEHLLRAASQNASVGVVRVDEIRFPMETAKIGDEGIAQLAMAMAQVFLGKVSFLAIGNPDETHLVITLALTGSKFFAQS